DIPQPGQPLDIRISVNLRFTQKLSVINLNTLQQTRRTNTRIPLSNDPLGPGAIGSGSCSPTGRPCDPARTREFAPTLRIYFKRHSSGSSPRRRSRSGVFLNRSGCSYRSGSAVPSDHRPAGTMNTSIGSGAPLNWGFSMTGELDRSAPQAAPSM